MPVSRQSKPGRNCSRRRVNESHRRKNSFDNRRELSFASGRGRMKPVSSSGRYRAVTLIEVVVVIAVVVVLVGLVLPALGRAKRKTSRVGCANCLKQVGLSFRMFANDNEDKSSWHISTNNGGSREYLEVPNSAFRHFQVMSNELSTPKIRVCPEDRERVWSTNWVA